MDFYIDSGSSKTLVSSSYVLSQLSGAAYDSTNDLAAVAAAESDPNITDISLLYPTYSADSLLRKAIEAMSSSGKIDDFMTVESISFLLAYSKPMQISILYCLINGLISGSELSDIRNGSIPNVREYLEGIVMKGDIPSAYLTLKKPRVSVMPQLSMEALKMAKKSAIHSELSANPYFSDSGKTLYANAIASKYASSKLLDLADLESSGSSGTRASDYVSSYSSGGSLRSLFSGEVDFERKAILTAPHIIEAKASEKGRDLMMAILPALDVSGIDGVINAAENAEYLAGFESGTAAMAEADISDIESSVGSMALLTGTYANSEIVPEFGGIVESDSGPTYYFVVNMWDRTLNKGCPASVSVQKRKKGTIVSYDKLTISVKESSGKYYPSFFLGSETDSSAKLVLSKSTESTESKYIVYLPGKKTDFFSFSFDQNQKVRVVLQAAARKKYCSECEYDSRSKSYNYLPEYYARLAGSVSKDPTLQTVESSGINYLHILNKAIKMTGRAEPQEEYAGKFKASSITGTGLSDSEIVVEGRDGIPSSLSYIADLCEDILSSAQSALVDSSDPKKIPAVEDSANPYALYFESSPIGSVSFDASAKTASVNSVDSESYSKYFMEAIGLLGTYSGYSGIKSDVSLLGKDSYLREMATKAFGDLYLKYEKTNSEVSAKVELLKFFFVQLTIMSSYYKVMPSEIKSALGSNLLLETFALMRMSERFFSSSYGCWYQEILRPMSEKAFISLYKTTQMDSRTDAGADFKFLVKKCLSWQFTTCASQKPISGYDKDAIMRILSEKSQILLNEKDSDEKKSLIAYLKTLDLASSGGSITDALYEGMEKYLAYKTGYDPDYYSAVSGMYGGVRDILSSEGLL